MTVIEALSEQTVPVERRILGRASVLVDLLTEGWVHSSTAVLWGPGVTQSADPPPRYYTADRSDQRSDQLLSLRLILQRLGTCYHWHSIIRRPVSDQLIAEPRLSPNNNMYLCYPAHSPLSVMQWYLDALCYTRYTVTEAPPGVRWDISEPLCQCCSQGSAPTAHLPRCHSGEVSTWQGLVMQRQA